MTDGKKIARRHMEPNPIIRIAGFQKEHAALGVGGEPVRQDAAGGPGADYDVVIVSRQPLHDSRPAIGNFAVLVHEGWELQKDRLRLIRPEEHEIIGFESQTRLISILLTFNPPPPDKRQRNASRACCSTSLSRRKSEGLLYDSLCA
jgi:hypothetical protein